MLLSKNVDSWRRCYVSALPLWFGDFVLHLSKPNGGSSCQNPPSFTSDLLTTCSLRSAANSVLFLLFSPGLPIRQRSPLLEAHLCGRVRSRPLAVRFGTQQQRGMGHPDADAPPYRHPPRALRPRARPARQVATGANLRHPHR